MEQYGKYLGRNSIKLDNLIFELDENVIHYCIGSEFPSCKKNFDVEVIGLGAISVTYPQ